MVAADGWKQRCGLTVCITALVWLALLGLSALDPRVHASGLLLPPGAAAATTPPPPKSVPYKLPLDQLGSPDIPLDDPRLKKVVGPEEPEQIHLALAGDGAMFVAWTTGDAKIVGSDEEAANALNHTFHASTVEYGTSANALDSSASGSAKKYVQDYPGDVYVSGVMHHAKLAGLQPLTTYFYRCGDAALNVWSRVLNFTTLQATGPDAFPQRFGLVGDLGQTHNSSSTLGHLIDADLPVVILTGDYCYADSYFPNGDLRYSNWTKPPSSYQPRWDSWGRFVEPLASKVPLMAVSGNHEQEPDHRGEMYQAYKTRYIYPYKESKSPSHQEYSFDAAGVHWVMLGWTKTKDFNLTWLRKDLAAVDRERTPWLIAVIHPPWYNTYIAHYKENECMRIALEPTFKKFGVDVVFTGHVHAYERHNRVFNYTVDDCAPYHVTIGDGGNIERLYKDWVNHTACPKDTGPDAVTKCPTYQGEEHDEFCPNEQPSWSAYREPSFGMGVLDVKSPTEAEWTWHRNQDGVAVARDVATFTRGDPACDRRRAPPPALAPSVA